jgi:hypothetical protein
LSSHQMISFSHQKDAAESGEANSKNQRESFRCSTMPLHKPGFAERLV